MQKTIVQVARHIAVTRRKKEDYSCTTRCRHAMINDYTVTLLKMP